MTPEQFIAFFNLLMAGLQLLQKQHINGQIDPAEQQAMLDAVDGVRKRLTAPPEPFERIEAPEVIPVAEEGMPRVIINSLP